MASNLNTCPGVKFRLGPGGRGQGRASQGRLPWVGDTLKGSVILYCVSSFYTEHGLTWADRKGGAQGAAKDGEEFDDAGRRAQALD